VLDDGQLLVDGRSFLRHDERFPRDTDPFERDELHSRLYTDQFDRHCSSFHLDSHQFVRYERSFRRDEMETLRYKIQRSRYAIPFDLVGVAIRVAALIIERTKRSRRLYASQFARHELLIPRRSSSRSVDPPHARRYGEAIDWRRVRVSTSNYSVCEKLDTVDGRWRG
jgi:hypothetical protein